MQAIILAAGRGTRLKPLTDTLPKPLLPIGDSVLLEYIFRAVEPFVDEIVLVTNYCADQIEAYTGSRNSIARVHCVTQGSVGGTWGALLSAREFIRDEPFLVLNGDDYLEADDVKALLDAAPAGGVHIASMPGYEEILVEEGSIIGWRPRVLDPALCATGAYALTKDVFSFEPVFMNETEAGLPHTLFAHPEYRLRAVSMPSWMRVNTHDDLAELRSLLSL